MTFLAATRSHEAMVLTSDSRESSAGEERVTGTTKKISVARTGFLFAWSGYKYVAQAFHLAIRDAPNLSNRLPRAEVERQLLALLKQIQSEGKTDIGEWIVAWWCFPENSPLALQIFSDGRSEYVEGWDCCGGDAKAGSVARTISGTLSFVPRETLRVEQTKVLALKITRDTIRITGSSAVGGEVQIGVVTKNGAETVTGAKLEALHHAVGVWEKQMAGLLPGAETVPAASETPDRGIKLPNPPPSEPAIAKPQQGLTS